MRSGPSLTGRICLALGLTVLFYALALGIVAFCAAVVIDDLFLTRRLRIRADIALAMAGGAILWALVPRKDTFEAPGPKLKIEDHPRLEAEIKKVAEAAGQPMPEDVYLLDAVNAFVSERGGRLGFGGRRVLGIGLPLLQLCTIEQFRAVLAHEFGHFVGSDTLLGTFLYRTRTAIGRTVYSLGKSGSPVKWIFIGYGKLFLRITHAVSRAQEFSADAFSAQVTSPRIAAEALRKVIPYDAVYMRYWTQEVVPVLQAGRIPPIHEGLEIFCKSMDGLEILEHAESGATTAKADPYDTHPPLRERVEALGQRMEGAFAEGVSADTLLEGAASFQQTLLAAAIGPEKVSQLRPIDWDHVFAEISVPAQKAMLQNYRGQLAGITPRNLLQHVQRLAMRNGRVVRVPDGQPVSQAEMVEAFHVVWPSILVLFHDRCADPKCGVGAPFTVSLPNGERAAPLIELRSAVGELKPPEHWVSFCERAGVADVDLGSVVAG
ncbi:MAG: M48 family metallopeptidase [Planctomycetes bacterium]|nr:M48 family metallopeptidase [Planctomycetota bacterium]